MRKCLSCKEMNPEQQEFCTNCGTSLSSRRASAKKSNIQKPPLYLIVLAIVIIGLAIGFYIMHTEYGKKAVADQFISALIAQDTHTLSELIEPKDSRIAIDKDSLQALLKMIEINPSLVQTIENSLHKNDGLFTIRTSGKRLGVFPRYTMNPTGYIVEVESIGHETVLSTDNSEIGYIKHTGETAEFGPFLAGIYPIKMTTTIDDEDFSEEIQANIFGDNQTISLIFPSVEEAVLAAKNQNTQEAAVKNDSPADQIIDKETPVVSIYNDFFILPASGDDYLKTSDLKGLSKKDLRLARNEIYARYGYIFKSKELQTYFDSQYWYVPNETYGGSLTKWEKHNVELIKSKE